MMTGVYYITVLGRKIKLGQHRCPIGNLWDVGGINMKCDS